MLESFSTDFVKEGDGKTKKLKKNVLYVYLATSCGPLGRYTLLVPLLPPPLTSQEQCIVGDMGNRQAVCILLECILAIYNCCLLEAAYSLNWGA